MSRTVVSLMDLRQTEVLRRLGHFEITELNQYSPEEASVVLRADREKVSCSGTICVQPLRWGNLLVYGDWEPVVFACHSVSDWRARIAWIGGSSFYYAWEKARIGSGREFETDDVEIAKVQLLEMRRNQDLGEDEAQEVWEQLHDEDLHEARNLVYQYTDCERASSFGLIPEWRVFTAWAACRRAHELLLHREELERKVREAGIDYNELWRQSVVRGIGQHEGEWLSFLSRIDQRSRILQVGGSGGAEAFGLAHKASELYTVDNHKPRFDLVDIRRLCSYWYLETDPQQVPTDDPNNIHGTFDVVWVNWDKAATAVRAMFDKFWPLVRKGGIFAVHGIADTPAQTKAYVEVSGVYRELSKREDVLAHEIGPMEDWSGIGVLEKR
jgi:predicted O-methyltransferase YrrM